MACAQAFSQRGRRASGPSWMDWTAPPLMDTLHGCAQTKRPQARHITRMKFDTVVLGAGIVGVCVAVHLQKRGRQVALVDRKLPGNETSFGNAGLIQREGVYPYAFPRELGTLLR